MVSAKNILTKVTEIYSRLSSEYPFLLAVLLPAALTAAGVFILSTKAQGGFWLFSSMIVYAILLVAKVAIDYANVKRSSRLTSQVSTLQFQIAHTDEIVSQKREQMIQAITSSDTKYTLLRRARGKLSFERAASVINKECGQIIVNYLEGQGRAKGASFVSKIIVPDESGEFVMVGSPYKFGGSRSPNKYTGLLLSMESCVATRLWKDRGESMESFGDVAAAEKIGKFIFVHESHRNNLKSICCFRVSDREGMPVAIWSIDSDQTDVFPNNDKSELRDDLLRIFESFSLRLSLESIYDHILNETSEIYEEALISSESS